MERHCLKCSRSGPTPVWASKLDRSSQRKFSDATRRLHPPSVWETAGPVFSRRGLCPRSPAVSLDDVPDELPVYSADAICEYLFAGTAQEVWDLRTDFPGCLPQHPDLFLEMIRPSQFRSEATGTGSPRPCHLMGMVHQRQESHRPGAGRRPEYATVSGSAPGECRGSNRYGSR